MANEFKVKNGIKFPDDTIQTTAAGPLIEIYDSGIDDYDSRYLTGFYTLAATSTNGPDSSVAYNVYASSPGLTISQLAIGETNNVYTRASADGASTWTEWRRLVNTVPGASGNVLTSNGTSWVSQAPSGGSSTLTISNKTAAYTVVAGDLGKIINCTSGTFTVSLTAAATLGSGFNCWIWNNSTTTSDTITIDPSSTETIDGRTTLVLRPGEGLQVICDGTNWQTGDKKAMRGFAENIRSTSGEARPIASGQDSLAIGVASNSVGLRSVALTASYASGEDSFSAGNGNGTSSYGALGNGSIAVGVNSKAAAIRSISIGGLTQATSGYSAAIGNNSSGTGSQAITGSGAMALGGSYASGADSFAAGVANNTSTYGATNANGIVLGYLSKSTGTSALSLGYTAVSSGSYSTAIGYAPVASGTNAVAIGGWWNYGSPTASSTSSIAIGDGVTADAQLSVALGNAAITNGIKGKFVYSNGRFAANGDSQTGTFVLRRTTANGTATALTTDDTAAGGDDQIILPNNSAYAFTGIVVARQQASAGTASAAWEIKGLIRREGSAGTTTLVNSALTVINNAPGWTIALSADTTNGGLAVTITGAAATNIRWVATVQTSEVTYA